MSYGQELLKRYLVEMIGTNFEENARPDWLQGLELDFYYPTLKIAFEFDGGQHFLSLPGFGNVQGQQDRDKRKLNICRNKKINLIRIQACDLSYKTIVGFGHKCHYRNHLKKNWDKEKLKILDKESWRYIQKIRSKYNCPTGYKRGTKERVAMHKMHKNTEKKVNRLWSYTPKGPKMKLKTMSYADYANLKTAIDGLDRGIPCAAL